MKVKDAIAMLSKADPDENVVIGWWSKDLFSEDYVITDEVWEQVCERLNALTDRANEDVYEEVIYWLNEYGVEIKEDN